ncbi:hypothetical protein ACQCVH_11330 [Bacillus infantis]|uniref:hypothetical protein n=1 Tax=Bacillus infantis TaxID=324767 RepID=UPI003CF3EC7B
MEKEMQKAKNHMYEDELADFTFSEEMKKNVMDHVQSRSRKARKEPKRRFAPVLLTAAFIFLSSAGVYQLATVNEPDQNAGHEKEEPPAADKKPELIIPGFIPEGYVSVHVKTNGEMYQQLYVKEGNEEEYFTYTMQKAKVDTGGAEITSIPLASDLQGSTYHKSEQHSSLYWQDEGFYQIVEKEGSMSEGDFLKIVDSIITEKGHLSYLEGEIARLDAEAGKNETSKEPIEQKDNQTEQESSKEETSNQEEQTDKEEQADTEKETAEQNTEKENQQDTKEDEKESEIPALSESEAKAMLVQFKATVKGKGEDLDIANDHLYTSLRTKEDYYAQFTGIMDRGIIEDIFSHRLKEKADGLHAVPKDSPVFFVEQTPFSVQKINSTTYQLKQDQTTDLYGSLTLVVTYKLINGKWLITDYQPHN